jgi:Fic family protein
VEILKSALKANHHLAKLNGLSQLLPKADLLMAPLLVKESVASSAIENINTTTQKVLQEEAMKEKKLI